jgi:hypothetical protein
MGLIGPIWLMKKLISLTIFFFGLLFLANHAQAGIIIRPVINTGLIGYWSFNEGTGTRVEDISGHGNHGTWYGSSTSHWADGKFGKGGIFNEANSDYVSCGSSEVHNINGNITISAWVKIEPMASDDIYIIAGRGAVGYYLDVGENGYYLAVRKSGGDPYLQFNVGGATQAGNPSYSGGVDGLWHHVVGVKNANNYIAIYVDGEYKSSDARAIGDMSAPGETFYIGRNHVSGTSAYLAGQVDEVRIYNRDLDASEIRKLYDSGLAKMGINQLGLVPDDLPANATISYVREDCSGYSPCYTSLHAWNDALGGFDFADHSCASGDLTCLDKTAVAKIDGAWNSPDTAALNITGWTTDATRYIKIYTTSSARHPGKWDETRYRLETTGSAISISEEYIRISGLQVKTTVTTDYQRAIFSNINNASSDLRISDNLVWGICSSSLNDCAGISTTWNGTVNAIVQNNIVYGTYRGIYPNQGANIKIYNNTVVDGGWGFGINGTVDAIAKNNLSYNNSDNYADAGGSRWNDYSANNLSGPGSDSYCPSANSRNGAQVNFVDVANDDYHLSPADGGARNYGTDLSGSGASVSFSTDIDRQARTTPWDIGADEARGTITGASQANQITNGLVGYWSFNGPDIDGDLAYDRSTSGNNGTISGATKTIGKVGQALTFSHADARYVYVGDSASLLDLPNTALTLSLWLKRADDDANEIFSKCESSNTSGWYFSLLGSRMASFFTQRATTDLWVTSSINTIPSYVDGWVHLAVTYPGGDEADNVHIYANGSEVSSYTTQQDGQDAYVSDSGLQARIGRGCWGNYTDGVIDEMRLYNRALTQEEIKRLYNLGR